MMNVLGKLAIIACNVSVSYFIISTHAKYEYVYLNLSSIFDPIYLIFIESIIVAQIFMSMYTTMGSCMLHCLFQDVS